MQAARNDREEDARPVPTSSSPAIWITLIAAVCAGLAGSVAPGWMGWIAIGAAAMGGAWFVSRVAGTAPAPSNHEVGRARRLLSLVERGGSADANVPSDFTDEWAQLYEKVNQLASESRTSPAALAQLEQFRKQAELAAELLRQGNDPLVESPELRAGPLLPLLEGLKASAEAPVVSRMQLGDEEELIGAGSEALPPDWPMPTEKPNADLSGIETGLRGLIAEIEALRGTLSGGANGAAASSSDDPALRTPAQLVDAVVLTAADGIEDLAAGLMRANELASVAERVTNRATLLALNAALEATRSGSEAFAAIAEETRRLAEFAREATDTIARLSSEIEYKVGETITAIHATSEDAKTSLAQMGGAPVPENSSARNARAQVVRLLDHSRELLQGLDAPEPAGPAPKRDSVSIKSSKEPAALAESPDSVPDMVENTSPAADNQSVEGLFLIEGLKPGADLES